MAISSEPFSRIDRSSQIFSRIDHFLENHCKTMGLFRTLLRHPRNPAVKMKRLVEIMAINMFEIENLVDEGSVFCSARYVNLCSV